MYSRLIISRWSSDVPAERSDIAWYATASCVCCFVRGVVCSGTVHAAPSKTCHPVCCNYALLFYRHYCSNELSSHCSEVVTDSRVYIMGHAADQVAQPAASHEVASSCQQPRTALQSRPHPTQSGNTGNSPCRLQSGALQAAGPPCSKTTMTLKYRGSTTVLHNHHLTANNCLLTPKISK